MLINLITVLIGLAVAANRVTEVLKRSVLENVPYLQTHPDLRRNLTYAFSLLAGIVTIATVDPTLALFQGTVIEDLNPTVVMIATGLLVGALSNAAHVLINATTQKLGGPDAWTQIASRAPGIGD